MMVMAAVRRGAGGAPHMPSSCLNGQVAEGVALAARCSRAVREAGVMSRNERVEDINTEDLRYLLVDYYHAGLLQAMQGPSVRTLCTP